MKHFLKLGGPVMAALFLSSCASTRHVDKNEAEASRSFKADTTRTVATADTATHRAVAAASYTEAGTTTSRDSTAGTETSTTVYTYDAAGRVASKTKTKRTTGTKTSHTDYLTGGDIAASMKEESTAKSDTKTTTAVRAEETTKSRSKSVALTGHPWYYWPVRVGIGAAACVVLYSLWGPLSAALGWLFAAVRRKKKADETAAN